MITQSRWLHILGVAKKCKELAAKLKPNNSQFAEDMFLIGLLHDIGYEFTTNNASHAQSGGTILKRNNYKYWHEIALHGDESVDNMTDELFILNYADMSTGPKGENFTFEERLAEIASRFGKDSNPYKKCIIVVEKIRADKRYIKTC